MSSISRRAAEFAAGEFEHTVSKNRLIFGKTGQRRGRFGGFFHGARMLSFGGMTTRLRFGAFALAAALAMPMAFGVKAQNAPPEQTPTPADPAPATQADQTPIFRTDINFVRVDVIVSDRQGNPVHDLKQEDFEVTEDGKPQAIQTFKLINVSENAGVAASRLEKSATSRGADRGGARRCAALAIFLDVIMCGSKTACARVSRCAFHRESLQRGTWRLSCSSVVVGDVMMTRNRRAWPARFASSSAASTTTRRVTRSRRYVH